MQSYQVLARKWRPRQFADMIGQEQTLRMLTNALQQQRLHHAYLFTGTRGVGKTTLARLLAKCLNCETGMTPTPCDTCTICTAINAGQFLDLYEIDAASRTKVEDTRELLENVPYPPTQGRYKVYLIDEVHMLSNYSFNALLKTLEEPPAHVKFILATTEPKRLPITILSRCLQFHLKRIPAKQIAQYLQKICHAETLTAEPLALEKIAQAADGSMRDALSLLDQAIAYGQGGMTAADVNLMLGSLAQEDLQPLFTALLTHDGKTLFSAITQLAERAPDFEQLLEEVITLLHRIALLQVIPDPTIADTFLTTFAAQCTPEQIQLYYQIALLGRRDMMLAPHPQLGFEMTCIRMLAFTLAPHPVEEKENVLATSLSSPPPLPTTTNAMPQWREVVAQLGLSGLAQALANNCTLLKVENNRWTLALATHHQAMLNSKLKERLVEALTKHCNAAIQLDIQLTEQLLETPMQQTQTEKKQRIDTITQTLVQHPVVKQLLDTYDATVEIALL